MLGHQLAPPEGSLASENSLFWSPFARADTQLHEMIEEDVMDLQLQNDSKFDPTPLTGANPSEARFGHTRVVADPSRAPEQPESLRTTVALR